MVSPYLLRPLRTIEEALHDIETTRLRADLFVGRTRMPHGDAGEQKGEEISNLDDNSSKTMT